MKKLLSVILILSMVLILFGCGETKIINGTEYDTYGLLNSDDKKNTDIEYGVIWGNVIWGAILIETIVAPIYFFGFSLFEPVGTKDTNRPKGSVRR